MLKMLNIQVKQEDFITTYNQQINTCKPILDYSDIATTFKMKVDSISTLEIFSFTVLGILSYAALGNLSHVALGILSLAALGIISLVTFGILNFAAFGIFSLAVQKRTIQLGCP